MRVVFGIVCQNYIRQNYSWECWLAFCVLAAEAAAAQPAPAPAWTGVAADAALIPVHDHNAWWKVSLGFLVSYYFGMLLSFHVKTTTTKEKEPTQIMHVWDFQCINVSINDLRIPILFGYWGRCRVVCCALKRFYSYLTGNLCFYLEYKKDTHTNISHWIFMFFVTFFSASIIQQIATE